MMEQVYACIIIMVHLLRLVLSEHVIPFEENKFQMIIEVVHALSHENNGVTFRQCLEGILPTACVERTSTCYDLQAPAVLQWQISVTKFRPFWPAVIFVSVCRQNNSRCVPRSSR